MEKKSLTGFKDTQNPKEEKTEIKFNQIKSVAVDEFDSENTIVLIASLVVLATMIGLAVYNSIQSELFNW